jgi:hypothetical protein
MSLLDGTTYSPTGSPNFFMNFAVNSVNLWKFHVDFTNPTRTTFAGPTNIPVAAFNEACSGGGARIPQPGTNNKFVVQVLELPIAGSMGNKRINLGFG